MCILPFTFSREEYIQIKFIKLTLFCDSLNTFRNLVCQHDHSRKRSIWIIITFPLFLRSLFIRVCPVINLFFDELTGIQCSERRTGQIQIIGRCDRQPCFIVSIAGIVLCQILVVSVFIRFKELLGTIFPRAKMVFVKYNQIPVCGMHPLVIRLDSAGLFIYTKEILEGTEAHDWSALISPLILFIIGQSARCSRPCDKLPTFKIHMRHEIFTPCSLNCRLKGKDQDPLESHLLC